MVLIFRTACMIEIRSESEAVFQMCPELAASHPLRFGWRFYAPDPVAPSGGPEPHTHMMQLQSEEYTKATTEEVTPLYAKHHGRFVSN